MPFWPFSSDETKKEPKKVMPKQMQGKEKKKKKNVLSSGGAKGVLNALERRKKMLDSL